MEIAEDAEEDIRRQSTVPEERPATAKDLSESSPQMPLSSVSSTLQSPGFDSLVSYGSATTESEVTTTLSYRPQQPPDGDPGSPTKSIGRRRKSSQSTRPENYTYYSSGANGKPKVKLGPRPSLDTSGRPHTSASSANYRPVSTLPAGLKLFSRNSKKQKGPRGQDDHDEQNGRPKTQYPTTPPSMTLSPPPIDASAQSQQTVILMRPHTSGGQPTASSGSSVKSPMSPVTPTPKLPALTPEKMRLLKALEIRKKQRSANAQADLAPTAVEDSHLTSAVADSSLLDSASEVAEEALSSSNIVKSDSAIAIEVISMGNLAESVATITNSNPASPLEPSEESRSTRASSVSDSTDETVQGQNLVQSNIVMKCVGSVENGAALEIYGDEVIKEATQVGSGIAEDDETRELPPMDDLGREEDKEDMTYPHLEESKAAAHNSRPEEAEGVNHSSEEILERTGSMINGKSEPQLRDDEEAVEGEPRLATENEQSHPQMQPETSQKTPGALAAMPEDVKRTSTTNVSTEISQTPATNWESKIPRSKFSVQDLRSEIAEIPSQKDTLPAVDATSSTNSSKSPTCSKVSDDAKRWDTEDGGRYSLSKQKKRKGRIEPIRTDIGVSERCERNSEVELLLDDDLMDELQSATVQEAKPISVSKSPITPVFPSQVKKAAGEGNRFSRAFSNPLRKDNPKNQLLSPHPSSNTSRSVSASDAYLNHVNQQPTMPIIKKTNLGSGISQRIKALEKLSGNPSLPSGGTGPAPGSSTSFFSVRKPGSRGSKSPSIIERAESLTRNTPSPSMSRESSPEALKLRDRSGSIQSRREAFNSPNNQPQRSRPESISVTARIVRDPNQPFPSKPEMPKNALVYTPLDLKQSPLLIDHQKAIVVPQSPPKETIQERRFSKESKEARPERRSSITIVRDLIKERRSSFAERRKSMTIDTPARSPAPSPSRPPSTYSQMRPMSVSSRRSNSSRDLASLSPVGPPMNPSPTNSEDTVEKKAGRATRMLRRMSSSISAGRKSIAHVISPTVREESEPPQTKRQNLSSQLSRSPPAPTITVDIGDVNVQFPDTLLWKRRTMIIDSQGFLLLSQAQGGKVMEKSTSLKKYHLSEFRVPFIPEMEAQELPNSVVLDFTEGSGLQVACEDRVGQIRVLQGTLYCP
jgi:hypothetical protein